MTSSSSAGLHLLPHSVSTSAPRSSLTQLTSYSTQVAISTGSVFAGWSVPIVGGLTINNLNNILRMMRRTGKLYALTIISGLMTVVAGVLLTFWNEDTSQLHLWLDIVPQGFGMASFITTTLIVSYCVNKRLGKLHKSV